MSPSSVPIRNIPKKQRVNEIYVQSESVVANEIEKVSKTSTNEPIAAPAPSSSSSIESSRKSQVMQKAGGKRKHNVIATVDSNQSETQPEEEKKVVATVADGDDDEKLLMATANLLNETEVPKSVAQSAEIDKVSNAQSPATTFHKSNDIDKRNLPPKERNKRIFRARNQSPDVQSVTIASEVSVTPVKSSLEEQTSTETIKVMTVNKNDRQEMMLPHKKKQSSRLPLTTSVTSTEIAKNQPIIEVIGSRNKKKRKSSSDAISIEEFQAPKIDILPESPLRESANELMQKSPVFSVTSTTTMTTSQIRGQKRHLSIENSTGDPQMQSQQESKRFHKSHDLPLEPRTFTCGASEAICITSKGTLTVARRDSLKTTQANSVVVTSQVIISEPIISTISTPSSSSSKPTVVSLPQQSLKNALKIPKENMEELKKQGLLTIENNRTKLTPKGLQIFKEYQRDEKMVTSSTSSSSLETSSSTVSITSVDSVLDMSESKITESDETKTSQELENIKNDAPIEMMVVKDKEEVNKNIEVSDNNLNVIDSSLKEVENQLPIPLDDDDQSKKKDDCQNGQDVDTNEKEIEKEASVLEKTENPPISTEEKIAELIEESVETCLIIEEPKDEIDQQDKGEEVEEEESTKDEKKDHEEKESSDSEQIESTEKPKENGSTELKDDEMEVPNEDANTSSGAGLIALQAETFGGPPNCFYLCRQVEDRYEPVDNQILVLNAQNALVPYEGEVLSEVAIPSGIEHPSIAENLSAYSQLSPNSNIIINTPNGQKVELNYFAIVALQESADENGIASVELGGEQIELNINGILEAIAAQQETDSADLLPGTMLIDGADNASASSALILTEPADLPVDINHSATQVSETLSKPIMSTTIAPEIAPKTIADKNLNIDDSLASIGVTSQATRANVPKSLELPITVTNQTIVGKYFFLN